MLSNACICQPVANNAYSWSLPKRTSASSSLLAPALPPDFSPVAPSLPNTAGLSSFIHLSFHFSGKLFYYSSHLTLFFTCSSLPAHVSLPLFHSPLLWTVDLKYLFDSKKKKKVLFYHIQIFLQQCVLCGAEKILSDLSPAAVVNAYKMLWTLASAHSYL